MIRIECDSFEFFLEALIIVELLLEGNAEGEQMGSMFLCTG